MWHLWSAFRRPRNGPEIGCAWKRGAILKGIRMDITQFEPSDVGGYSTCAQAFQFTRRASLFRILPALGIALNGSHPTKSEMLDIISSSEDATPFSRWVEAKWVDEDREMLQKFLGHLVSMFDVEDGLFDVIVKDPQPAFEFYAKHYATS